MTTVEWTQPETIEAPPKAPAAKADSPNLLDLQTQVNQWHDDCSIAFSATPLKPGPWLDMIDAFLVPRVLSSGGQVIGGEAAALRLECNHTIPRFVPVDSLPADAVCAMAPTPAVNLSIKILLRLYQSHIQELWVLEPKGWTIYAPEALLSRWLYKRKVKRWVRRILPTLFVDDERVINPMADWFSQRHGRDQCPATRPADPARASLAHLSGEQLWARAIEEDNAAFTPPGQPTNRPWRIMQYTGSLYSGGAERQLCNVAIGLSQRGFDSIVRTQHELKGEQGHYHELLDEVGIDARDARDSQGDADAFSRIRWDLIAAAPDAVRPHVARLAIELATNPPDVLHAWLDHPNVIAGLAGIAAGVNCVLLSTRNYNPTCFPRFYHPFVDWYRVVAKSRRVHWLANSHAGAESYAKYVGIPVERFHIVLNGLFQDHFDRPTTTCRAKARQKLGLPIDAPVVAVVNRLDEEKQPELMLKVARLLRDRMPNLRIIVAGSGPLEADIRETIKRRGLEDCVTLLGRVNNVVEVLTAANVLLLTSRYEGCPNVALEAQHIGIPVVATNAGGTADAVQHGVTGFIHPIDDPVGLVMDLQRVLKDPDLQSQFGTNAQRFVDECFSLDQMVDLTCRVYEVALDGNTSTRIETPTPQINTNSPASSTSTTPLPEVNVIVTSSTTQKN